MEDIKEIINRIKAEFIKIGARIKIIPFTPSSKLFRNNLMSITVEQDEKGEFFEVLISRDLVKGLKVVRVNKESGHLIIVAGHQNQYLCGHYDSSLHLTNLVSPRESKKAAETSGSHAEKITGSYILSSKPGLNFAVIKYIFNKMQSSAFNRNFS